MKKHLLYVIGGVSAAVVLAGCGDNVEILPVPTASGRVPSEYQGWKPAGADAGYSVENAPQDPMAWSKLVASASFASRPNPFALQMEERRFETEQQALRVFAETGGFSPNYYVEPPTTLERPVFEDQPYRRLAGVIVGDSILAIIEMGNGQPPQIIRPGQQIPNSEWYVVSIDEKKAVLRRKGNKLPREIVVRLESRPFGQGSDGGAGGGGNGGGGGTGGGPRGIGPAGAGGGPAGGGPAGAGGPVGG